MKNTSHQDKLHIEGLERQKEALALRKMGFSYTEIAQHMNVARQTAHNYVKRALTNLRNNISEEAEELRTLEMERLDAMQVRLWRQAMPGKASDGVDLKAMETLLKVMDRRARLLGLDSATKVEHITMDKIEEQIQKLEIELGRKANAAPPTEE